MKWFCPIFCLYLLTLSCLPCTDGEHDHTAHNTGTTTFFTTSGSSSEHSHCNDRCSPMCGCQCCSVIFTVRQPATFEFQKFEITGQKRVFPDRLLWVKDVIPAIDHPPQLV
ncbi:hypothetical protein ANRL2_02723 [Anaerolineae bacterium]|nr:hypothetical protein ANRL2_02723 [Anaerolineae bacterium]